MSFQPDYLVDRITIRRNTVNNLTSLQEEAAQLITQRKKIKHIGHRDYTNVPAYEVIKHPESTIPIGRNASISRTGNWKEDVHLSNSHRSKEI